MVKLRDSVKNEAIVPSVSVLIPAIVGCNREPRTDKRDNHILKIAERVHKGHDDIRV